MESKQNTFGGLLFHGIKNNLFDEDVCRTCLNKAPPLFPITSEITELIKRSIPDQKEFLKDNFLPSHICISCYAILLKIEKFKRQVKEVTMIFKLLEKPSKSDYRNFVLEERKQIAYPSLSKSKIIYFDSSESDDCDFKFKFSVNIERSENGAQILKKIQNVKPNLTDLSIIKTELDDYDAEAGFDIFDEVPLIYEVNKNNSIVDNIKKEDIDSTLENKNIKKNAIRSESAVQRKKTLSLKSKQYTVIKLTKTQVLEEMESASKNDSFLNAQFKCNFCIKTFMSDDVLQSHLAKHEKNSAFECDICHQFLATEASLYRHIKSHQNKYKCKLCPIIRASPLRIVEHHALEHGGNPTVYSCDVCKKKFIRRNMFQKHIRVHFTNAKIPCEKCGNLFKSMDTLRAHTLRYHTKVKHFTCDQCPKTFLYASLLKTHQSTHATSRDFYCVECNLNFKTHSTLTHHLKNSVSHMDLEKLKFPCNQCPKRFSTENNLRQHSEKIHLVDKYFKCDKCNIQFKSNEHLQSHIKKNHSGLKLSLTFSCDICQKAFGTRSQLVRHLRVHTGEKPFDCSVCQKRFSQKSTMVTHCRLVHRQTLDYINEQNKTVPKILLDDEAYQTFEEQSSSQIKQTLNIPQYYYISSNIAVFSTNPD